MYVVWCRYIYWISVEKSKSKCIFKLIKILIRKLYIIKYVKAVYTRKLWIFCTVLSNYKIRQEKINLSITKNHCSIKKLNLCCVTSLNRRCTIYKQKVNKENTFIFRKQTRCNLAKEKTFIIFKIILWLSVALCSAYMLHTLYLPEGKTCIFNSSFYCVFVMFFLFRFVSAMCV